MNELTYKHYLYVGTFGKKGEGGGIGIFHYDPENGSAEYVKTVRTDVMAGQMFIDAKRRVLYTVDERREDRSTGEIGGRVFAFAIDDATGDLTEINHKSAFGTMTAYLTDDATGNYIMVCNHSGMEWVTRVSRDFSGRYHLDAAYADTTLVLYPLEENGAIGDACDVRCFPVEGGFTSCLHSVLRSPDGEFYALCDRNHNRVYFFRLDYEHQRFVPSGTLEFPWGETHKGGHAPRYGAFHPTKKLFYFNSEYKPLLTTVAYDSNGGLSTVRIQDTIPQIAGIENMKYSQSDLRVSPDGRFLYELFRGVNAICTYAVDDETGLPEMIQTHVLAGEGPRGLQFSPDGRFILVANLDTGDVETLAVQSDGTVKPTGAREFGMMNPGNLSFYDIK